MRLEHDWAPLEVPDNVVLGEGCYLHSAFAFLHFRSERPAAVRIGHDTAVYDTSMFDLGPDGSVEIGDYGLINSSHFIANSRIVVGDFVYMSSEVYITDASAPVPPIDSGFDTSTAREDASIVIGDDCWVGLRSVVLGGTRLGRGVIVGAGSVVSSVVPDYSIVAGNPARVVGSVTPGEGTRGTQSRWWEAEPG